MDVKKAFDYISIVQLFIQIFQLGFENNLVSWTSFFLTNQRVQLVIDGYDNEEIEIGTRISQDSPISLIFFLIYISEVLNKVAETSPLVISLTFINDLGFIALARSVKKIVIVLEKVTQEVIE